MHQRGSVLGAGVPLFFLFFFFFLSARGAPIRSVSLPEALSPSARMSVLTIYPRSEAIHEIFGHTLVRVQDDGLPVPLDVVFDYGVFTFEDDFYWQYFLGNLRYYVGLKTYEFSYQRYARQEDRAIHEQALQLTPGERATLYRLLMRDLTTNNPYLYNYFTNNCSSKVRDVVEDALQGALSFPAPSSGKGTVYSYRTLFLVKFGSYYPWTEWMASLLAGPIADLPIDHRARMFLPEHLEAGFASAVVWRDGRKTALALPSRVLHKSKKRKPPPGWRVVLSPFAVSLLLLCLVLGITYKDMKRKRLTRWLDAFLFSLSAFLGVLQLFFWLFTQHSCAYNYHLLWAFPGHVLAVYGLRTPHRKWAIGYWRVVLCLWAVFAGLVLFTWPLLQHIVEYLPLVLSLLARVSCHLLMSPSVGDSVGATNRAAAS